MTYFTTYSSPIGPLILFSDGTALTHLLMDGQTGGIPSAERMDTLPLFREVAIWLDAYFRGEPQEITFPLSPAGTAFQRRIWDRLLAISYGETVTYGTIARELSPTMSAQAVGQAVGRNPISIIIPCHRVVGTNNKLTGYAGGLDKKVWLLGHEEAI